MNKFYLVVLILTKHYKANKSIVAVLVEICGWNGNLKEEIVRLIIIDLNILILCKSNNVVYWIMVVLDF